jgi:hypothetical protein
MGPAYTAPARMIAELNLSVQPQNETPPRKSAGRCASTPASDPILSPDGASAPVSACLVFSF